MKDIIKRVKTNPDVEVKARHRKRRDFNIRRANERVYFLSGIIINCTGISKVYWPGEGYTKGDLIDYYFKALKYILPYLKERPQPVKLYPEGIRGKNVFQEATGAIQIPEWIPTITSGDALNHIICNDAATLIYMAEIGCIEIYPWNSTLSKPENPTYFVIDLDPGNISFVDVVNTALVIKELCDEADIPCYCKTSGEKGLQIYFPLGGMYDYDQTNAFARTVAEITHKRLPSTTSIERMVARRRDKVYIDFRVNGPGQSMVAPYSVRARPYAPVSAPLEWDEVDHRLSPDMFNIRTMIKRFEEKGDLWRPVLGRGISFPKALPVLEKLA